MFSKLAARGECPSGTNYAVSHRHMLHHCWHDINVKVPGGRLETVNAPTADGRVCCYCGDTRTEPLPPMRPRRSHGPHVDDDSEWYVEDAAECRGLAIVDLNPASVAVGDGDVPKER